MRIANDTAVEEVSLSGADYIMPARLRALFSSLGRKTMLQHSNDNNRAADINIEYCSPQVPDFLQLNVSVTNSSVKACLIHVI